MTKKYEIDYILAAESLLIGAEKILDTKFGALYNAEAINIASQAIQEASSIVNEIGSCQSYVLEVGFRKSLNNLVKALSSVRSVKENKG